jgi:hypothetical protein
VKTVALVCIAVLSGAFGCAAQNGQFKDQPVVWRVDDTKDIKPPEEREFLLIPFGADSFFTGRLLHALGIPDREPAWNTNALDEVPNSTWFENRIGVRQVTPREAATGPSSFGPPKLPLTVVGGKTGGGNPGFLVKDARGSRFLVKFDIKSHPELETAASVIVNRIFWTLGYFVPNDTVFDFSRAELALDPKAKLNDEFGRKRRMTAADIDTALSGAPRLPDGRYRASASEFLKGEPKGGFPAKGVRSDDPNDTVPHQHRREVRAIRVFAAWVNHSDIKEDNTLDMYVEENGRRFLRHYLLDFGEALVRGRVRARLGLGTAGPRVHFLRLVEAILGRREGHALARHRSLRCRALRPAHLARGLSVLAILRNGRGRRVLGRQAGHALRPADPGSDRERGPHQ